MDQRRVDAIESAGSVFGELKHGRFLSTARWLMKDWMTGRVLAKFVLLARRRGTVLWFRIFADGYDAPNDDNHGRSDRDASRW